MPIQSISFGVSGALVALFWLAIAAALGVAVWAYRAPEPPLRSSLRTGLACLRFIALGTVVLALFQPVMTVASRSSDRPIVPVLLDLSASMNLPAAVAGSDTTTRLDVARGALAALRDELGSDVQLRVFGYGEGVREIDLDAEPVADLVAEGGATRLGPALSEALMRRLARRTPVGVVISDGSTNAGTDPLTSVERLGVPLVTVPVSSDSVVNDVWVAECLSNSTVFLGQATTVAVRVASHLTNAGQTRVQLLDGERVLVGDTVRLPEGDGDVEVQLTFRPERLGAQQIRVEVESLDGEVGTSNNARLLAFDVIEERLQVLLIADELSWDVTFLRRALDGDRTLETTMLARLDRRGDAYRQIGEGKIDTLPVDASGFLPFGAVVLLGVRPDEMPTATAAALADYVRDGGGWIVCTGTDHQLVRSYAQGDFAGLLPVRATGDGTSVLMQPEPTAAGLAHPVSALGESPVRAGALWAALPPAYRTTPIDAALGGDVLIEGQLGDDTSAFLVAGPAGRGRALVLAASEFWRWEFLMNDGVSEARLFERLVREGVRWVAEGRQRNNLEIYVDKPVFMSGERVSLGARLTDDRLQPVDDARVTIEWSTGEVEPLSVDLVPGETRGLYTGAAGFLRPGRYTLRGQATRGDDVWTAEGAHFIVDTANIEGTTPAADPAALRRLASATGGAQVLAADAGANVRELMKSRQQQIASKEVKLWNHPALFVLFVGALTLEWLLRRRNGLA